MNRFALALILVVAGSALVGCGARGAEPVAETAPAAADAGSDLAPAPVGTQPQGRAAGAQAGADFD
ncbi:MAG: hypothetical protein SNJ76_00400 [Fimbriimonadaceae bacterium]